jgi:hypothetical protein
MASNSDSSVSRIALTADVDWAPEAAIEAFAALMDAQGVPFTLFTTHDSSVVRGLMERVEVGVHPFFGRGSSHGESVEEVVRTVMALPHNLAAFRCHRFEVSNTSRQALLDAGMRVSTNVCTDLELVAPFRDRFGMLELPVFMEDGGYLYQQHPLELTPALKQQLLAPGLKTLLAHPMHMVLNTPHFAYMAEIKRSLTREQWRGQTSADLAGRRFEGRGIATLVLEMLDWAREQDVEITTVGAVARERGYLEGHIGTA